jgi:hypothetical protein
MTQDSARCGEAAQTVSPDQTQAFVEGGELRLPRFILRSAEGVFVELAHFGGSADFRQLVDRLFTIGSYFRGLDYAAFLRLAYHFEPGVVLDTLNACTAAGRPARVRFADALAHFVPARIGLYKGVKVVRGEAHYLFEPVTLDFEMDEAVYEEDEHGEQRLLRMEKRVVQQKTKLDIDEFVAQMWLKAVRFGVAVTDVAKAIRDGYLGRLVIARSLAPSDGHDAGVQELVDGLHRDDAPRVLSDGRVDLTQFRNRFPQIKAGTRLMRKTPLELGLLGHEVSGRPLPPPVPKDFELAALAGPGTRIERDGHGEYLLATLDGFLNIDSQTNLVSVMEKIVNRDGVSLRTTGDLALMGDEYEEHGEIQERRTVEGRTITTHADVFGRVVSAGGTITIKQNLSGGAAINRDGPVIVEGLAANAFIHAPSGEVTVRRAENSVIVGRRVVIGEQATSCDILAEELEIAVADGCALGARSVVIALARPRGQTQTLVSLLLPDLAAEALAVAAAREALAALDASDARAAHDAQALQALPEVAKYLMLLGKIRKQELTLTAEQKPVFQKLGERVAPNLRALGALAEQSRARAAERAGLEERIAALQAAHEAARAAVHCRIANVGGELIVRTVTVDPAAPPLAGLPPGELRARLRASAQGNSLLFSGAGGSFEWHWVPPGE